MMRSLSGTLPCSAARDRQQGAAVIVVMVLMMLAVLTALGTSRSQWLSERMVGSEADRQRALAAAEALLADAELDIRGYRFDNTLCSTNRAVIGCRDNLGGRPWFPLDNQDYAMAALPVIGSGNSCMDGICFTGNPGTWTPQFLKDNVAALTQPGVAATYGQFTGATAQAAGNPLLSRTTPRAWYWVEVFPYNSMGQTSRPLFGVPLPPGNSPIVFRITAHVQGMRPGTRVWVRSVLVLKSNSS